MTRIHKTAAAFAALLLAAGASAASAQTFTQGGQAVTASGTLVQNIRNPANPAADYETHCAVQLFGTVASDGSNIVFTSYTGANVNAGPLDCQDSITFPIEVTPQGFNNIELDQFIVGTRFFACEEYGYNLAYSSGVATFDGQWFGEPPYDICKAEGTLTIRANSNNHLVLIQ